MAPPESDPTHAAAPPALRFQWKEYRLLFYSALIGVAGGLAAQLFVWLLNTAEHFLLFGIAGYKAPEPGVLDPVAIVGAHGLWFVPVVTTLGGLVSGFLVYTFAPEAEGHGTDAAVESFHYKGGKIRPIVPLIKALSSAVTIGSGGAAGREGPTAQISLGVGSILADLLPRDPLLGHGVRDRGAHLHDRRVGDRLRRQRPVRRLDADLSLSRHHPLHAPGRARRLHRARRSRGRPRRARADDFLPRARRLQGAPRAGSHQARDRRPARRPDRAVGAGDFIDRLRLDSEGDDGELHRRVFDLARAV